MNKLKQGTAAFMLVMSLGLAVPSTFGGSVSADVSDRNPNSKIQTVHCDLVGHDGHIDATGTPIGYETEYKTNLIPNSDLFQVQGSNLVLKFRAVLDVTQTDYTVLNDPTGIAVDFHDPTGYWIDFEPSDNPKGLKTVQCWDQVPDRYAPYQSDVDLGIGFVQNLNADNSDGEGVCPDEAPAGVEHREDLPECVTYNELDTFLVEFTMSQVGKGKAQGGQHHAHKHHGKHGH